MTDLAFDRSERFKDQDGHLHVKTTNLSKSCVNPYRGAEIPSYQALGLKPDQIYQLFRNPDELAKAAPTFNNLRLMSRHVAVSANDPQEKLVAGSTGTDARFEPPYLVNSLVIWRQEDIDDVESREKCELSCGYYYDADMTPGTYQGLRYDGVMRNIRGNHVALVEAGRAGPDVLVHDSKENVMPLASRKALIVKGALAAYLKPRLLPGTVLALDSILGSVNGANWKTQKPLVLATVTALATPKLAQDAALTDLPTFIGALDEEDMEAEDEFEDDDDKKKKEAEDKAARDKKAKDAKPARDAKRAKDAKKGKDKDLEEWAEEEEDEPEHKAKDEMDDKAKDSGKAMDAAIDAAEKRIAARFTAAAEAREIVRPYVGQVALALDTAAGIYEFTLKANKVDTTGIDPSAYKAMVGMLPKPGQRSAPLAFDSLARDGGGLDTMFPAIGRISQ